ncbi:hypothetical protein K461DRAFT_312969 [Myriangium duriaei CBS 260.36]|uniref:Uncharacterized protein n=1 Tax=Myriangium duriaei CBS 260.36 TaxID=1168546 RepID=A0A9P4IYH3_9PEZI|nr:hypothetical protein K461DRAFT_312969 [Myriangium duriaei CBS 260.36]
MAHVTDPPTVGPSAPPKSVMSAVDTAAEMDRRHRERVNFAFRVGRHLKRVHKIVDPRAQEYYDDDNGDYDSADDDSDAYADSDNDEDVGDDLDHDHEEISSPQDGDEPYEPKNDDDANGYAGGDHHDTSNSHDTTTDITRGITQGAAKSAPAAIKLIPENVASGPPPPLPPQSAPPAGKSVLETNQVAVSNGTTSPATGQHSPLHTSALATSQTQKESTLPKTFPDQDVIIKPVKADFVGTNTDAKSTAVTKTAPATRSRPDSLAPTASAPFGYKVVKVRKQDGQIVQVKRPKTAEDAAKEATSAPNTTQAAAKMDGSGAQSKLNTTSTTRVQQTAVEPLIQLDEKSSNVQTSITPIQPAAERTDSKVQAQIHEKELVQSTVSPVNASPERANSKGLAQASKKEVASDEQPSSTKMRSFSNRSATFIQWFSWSIMILFSLVFLGLGIATAASNNHLIPNGRDTLQQAVKVAISLWPIVFAAIIAQTLKAYGAWKVERGIRLVTLEQLNSSHSVGAAIKQPFLLRQFNVATVGLLVIWLLSPLASQALVRMVKTKSVNLNHHGPVEYLRLQKYPYDNTVFDYGTDIATSTDMNLINTIYTSLLIANQNSRTIDSWGNPKIRIANTSNVVYSSLLGVPVAPAENLEESSLYKDNSNDKIGSAAPGWTFNMITSYFVLNCTDIVHLNLTEPSTHNYSWTTPRDRSLMLSIPETRNYTYQQLGAHPLNISYSAPGPSGTIYFGSRDSPGGFWETPDSDPELIWFSECSYHQEMVNTTMTCLGSNDYADLSCVASDRHIVPSSESDFKPLGLNFANVMMNVGGANNSNGQYSETEKYIYEPTYASLSEADQAEALNTTTGFEGITGDQIAENLGILVNTLWMAGHQPALYLGSNLTESSNTSGISLAGSVDGKAVGLLRQSYEVAWVWVVVLIVCSVLLLVAAVAAAMFEARTIGPDFLGFANTAIRKGVKLPPHMNALSARERLQAMQECEVLLQDVRPGLEMGKIALGVKDEKSVKLVHGRTYR